MAIIRGQKSNLVKEIRDDGVVTESEWNDRVPPLVARIETLEDATLPENNFDQEDYGEHLGEFHKQGSAGWKDNIINFTRIKTGVVTKQPIWIDIGNGLYGYMFSDIDDNESFADFHINHDYKENSPIYPHIHWMPLSHSIGNVRWEITYTVAKGHQQGDILSGAPTTIILDANANGIIGEHMVSEVELNQTFTCSEPDVVVKCRVRRLATDLADTFYGGVVGIMIDFHYESDKDFTINKAPNFYTGG